MSTRPGTSHEALAEKACAPISGASSELNGGSVSDWAACRSRTAIPVLWTGSDSANAFHTNTTWTLTVLGTYNRFSLSE